MDDIKVAAENAYATVVGQLAAPHFFEKVAAAGYAPQTEQEAAELWELGTKLHSMYAIEQEKAAAAQASNLAYFNRQLDEKLAGQWDQTAGDFDKFAAVADAAAESPEIANAVLTLQAAAAAAMAEE